MPRQHPRRDGRAGDDPGAERQEGEPGLDRPVAERLLQQQRDEVEGGELARAEQRHRHVGGRELPPREQAEADQRLRGPPFDRHEEREQHDGERQHGERRRRAPAVAPGAQDAEHERGRPARRQQRAGHVEAAGGRCRPVAPKPARRRADASLPGGLLARQRPPRSEQRAERDRHVDEQHPTPAGQLGQHAAQQHPDGAAGGGHGRPHSERAGSVRSARKGRREQRQRCRREPGGGDALERAEGDQLAAALRQAAGEAGEREQRERAGEQAPAAEQVAEPAAEQQQPAERDRVGVDDPGERGVGEAERVADLRQRDVHDRDVERDDELRRRDDGEHEPRARIFSVHVR
ncbi:MAG TPA: hypothetical protein VLK58_17060 [Conexibacter sp.]|nr:hypothetical protein [Conexibacter sp.]